MNWPAHEMIKPQKVKKTDHIHHIHIAEHNHVKPCHRFPGFCVYTLDPFFCNSWQRIMCISYSLCVLYLLNMTGFYNYCAAQAFLLYDRLPEYSGTMDALYSWHKLQFLTSQYIQSLLMKKTQTNFPDICKRLQRLTVPSLSKFVCDFTIQWKITNWQNMFSHIFCFVLLAVNR